MGKRLGEVPITGRLSSPDLPEEALPELMMRWNEGKEKRNRRLRLVSADARGSLPYLLKTNLPHLLTLPGSQCEDSSLRKALEASTSRRLGSLSSLSSAPQ